MQYNGCSPTRIHVYYSSSDMKLKGRMELSYRLAVMLMTIGFINGKCDMRFYFYNPATGKCEPCEQICKLEGNQKTRSATCDNLCPEYVIPVEPSEFESEPSEPKAINEVDHTASTNKSTYNITDSGGDENAFDNTPGLPVKHIIVIIVVCVTLLLSLAFVILCLKKKHKCYWSKTGQSSKKEDTSGSEVDLKENLLLKTGDQENTDQRKATGFKDEDPNKIKAPTQEKRKPEINGVTDDTSGLSKKLVQQEKTPHENNVTDKTSDSIKKPVQEVYPQKQTIVTDATNEQEQQFSGGGLPDHDQTSVCVYEHNNHGTNPSNRRGSADDITFAKDYA